MTDHERQLIGARRWLAGAKETVIVLEDYVAMLEGEPRWGIAYKPAPERPATIGGRVIARPEVFNTRPEAESFLERRNENGWLHPVELAR